MRVKAQKEILVGCSKRIILKNVPVFSEKNFSNFLIFLVAIWMNC